MPFRRVVIGVDFTEASLAAARGVALHLAPQAEVVLVHALPDPTAPPYLPPHLPLCSTDAASLAPVLHGAMRGLASVIGWDRARVHMTTGWPADALAHVAQEIDADLVCVGRGARRRGSARFGATTAQRLLARTRLPTLVVPAGRHDTPARIAAGLDDRPGAGQVVAVACRLAAAFEAPVDVVHVVGDEVQALARAGGGASESGATADLDWLRDVAHDWVARALERDGVASVRAAPVIRLGDPGDEIVAQLEAGTADLVVLGRGGDRAHASTRRGPFPVGSTTRLVAWAASCPVLVLTLDPPARSPRPPYALRAARRASRQGDAARDRIPRATHPTRGVAREAGRATDRRDGERDAS